MAGYGYVVFTRLLFVIMACHDPFVVFALLKGTLGSDDIDYQRSR